MIDFELQKYKLTISDNHENATIFLDKQSIPEFLKFFGNINNYEETTLRLENAIFTFKNFKLIIEVDEKLFTETETEDIFEKSKIIYEKLLQLQYEEIFDEPKSPQNRRERPRIIRRELDRKNSDHEEQRVRFNFENRNRSIRSRFFENNDEWSPPKNYIRRTVRTEKIFNEDGVLNRESIINLLQDEEILTLKTGISIDKNLVMTKVKLLEKRYILLDYENVDLNNLKDKSDEEILKALFSRLVIPLKTEARLYTLEDSNDIKDYHKELLKENLNPKYVSVQESRVILKNNQQYYNINKKIPKILEVNCAEEGFFLNDDSDQNEIVIVPENTYDYRKFKKYRICVPRIQYLKDNEFSKNSVEDEKLRISSFFEI